MFHGSSQVLPVMRQNLPLYSWIGAWNFTSVSNPNVVSVGTYRLGAMDSDIGKYPNRTNTIGTISTYPAGHAGSRAIEGIVVSGTVLATGTTGTTPASSDIVLPSFSFGAWVQQVDISKNPETQLILDSSSSMWVMGLGADGITFGSLTVPASTIHPTGQFRHFTYDRGVWKYYENGVLYSSGSEAARNLVFDRLYVRATTIANMTFNGTSPEIIDNIILTSAVLSASEMTDLAAGKFPNSAGYIV